MPDKPTLPSFIREFVLSASKEQKIELLSLLEDCSDLYLTADTASDSEVLAQSPSCSQISGFVSHIDKLPLTSSLSNDILTELTSLKLRTKGTKGKSAKVKLSGSALLTNLPISAVVSTTLNLSVIFQMYVN